MSDADSTQADTTQKDVWTILRMLQWTTEHLKKHGSGSPRLDAEVLLAHARNCQRIDLYAAYNEEPPESVKAIFRDLVKRRASGEPVAYLTGKKEFYSVPIRVSSDCLIPRPETEHVVVACLDRLKRMRGPVQIVDVCTGSGCIAAAVAKESQRLPEVQVTLTAIDLSPEALAIAKGNFEQLGFGGSIAVQQGEIGRAHV